MDITRHPSVHVFQMASGNYEAVDGEPRQPRKKRAPREAGGDDDEEDDDAPGQAFLIQCKVSPM